MTMIDWYKKCIHQYADFSTRARRSEYWYFYLANVIVALVLYALAFILIISTAGEGTSSPPLLPALLVGILVLYDLFILIPSLAVSVRRLHDIGKSGVNFLFVFIPLVGPILLLIWFCTDSQPGENKWGPNPKEINIDDYFNSVSST
jgi:uncharacterized membrane protein YhaH (DUF805 family)